jgi:glucose-1-phosphate thymidylyltransferase
MMVEEGVPFNTVAVTDWYDCGKKETWLATNRLLLDLAEPAGAGPDAAPSVYLGPDAVVTGSRLGPHVSVGPGAAITDCVLEDCVIGAGSRLTGCRLTGSIVGEKCVLSGVAGVVNVGDYTELETEGPAGV